MSAPVTPAAAPATQVPASAGTTAQTTLSFGARIEQALVNAWNTLKTDAEDEFAAAEQFGAQEVAAVENAIVATWNSYEPKAVALIAGYVKTALAQLGSGASVEQVAESVVAQDATGTGAFLNGALSAGLKAIVAALMASL